MLNEIQLLGEHHFLQVCAKGCIDDIDFYGKWKDGPADLDVDAIVKRWRNQER